MGNPFKALVDFYEKNVKEVDKQGLAPIFKECADKFFNDIQEGLKEYSGLYNNITITPIDILYLDGYFIYGTGTNSIVHFRIKETPGWLYGIWWHTPREEGDRQYIDGDFFAQYEEIIDKFKPSASSITQTVHIKYPLKKEYRTDYIHKVIEIIKFMIDEPYLAFCRHYWSWDYNTEYHSRDEAREKYEEYRKKKILEDEFTEESNRLLVEFINNRIIPELSKTFHNVFVYDNGKYVSPQFEIMAALEDNKDVVNQTGLYDWFEEDDPEKEQHDQLRKDFESFRNERKALARKLGIWWSDYIHETVAIYKKATIKRKKKDERVLREQNT